MTSLVAMLLAQTFFTWTDKAGVEHYTDDRSSIPKGAKISETRGEEISTIEVKGNAPHPVEPRAQIAMVEEETTTQRRQREDSWREAFRTARNKLADLEAEVESERKQVEEVSGLPITGRISCRRGFVGVPGQVPVYGVNTGGCYPGRDNFDHSRQRLEKNRRLLQRAKDDLADLERRAASDSIPLEWRR